MEPRDGSRELRMAILRSRQQALHGLGICIRNLLRAVRLCRAREHVLLQYRLVYAALE